jgi:hypothetical protein
MAVETTTDIQGLDPTRPNGSDPKAEGDDHLRLLKNVLQHCFAGFDGEVLLAASEGQGATTNDYVLTLTPAPTAYAAKTAIIFQATHANTGAATLKLGALSAVSILNPEGTALRANAITAGCMVMVVCDGTNFRLMAGNSQAIYDYVDQAQFQSALPGQASQGGKFLATNGTTANWKAALPTYQTPPTANEGPIYAWGHAVMEWNGTAYARVVTKQYVGLGNVDNTSDASKPISNATQTALNSKFDKTGGTINGSISVTGQVSSPAIVSSGNTYAGSGSAYLAPDGNLAGPIWGGALSTYLSGQLGGKVNARAGFGGQGYVINNSANIVALAWDGVGVNMAVDNTGFGRLWTTTMFDPNTKQNAGNYVGGSGATIQIVWGGSINNVRLVINGEDRGRIVMA